MIAQNGMIAVNKVWGLFGNEKISETYLVGYIIYNKKNTFDELLFEKPLRKLLFHIKYSRCYYKVFILHDVKEVN